MINAVYILANKRNGTLYTGVISNLVKRVWEHKNCFVDGLTKKYNCKMLVYYELCESVESAIIRETQVKKGSRLKKLKMIEDMNPNWDDLYGSIV